MSLDYLTIRDITKPNNIPPTDAIINNKESGTNELNIIKNAPNIKTIINIGNLKNLQ